MKTVIRKGVFETNSSSHHTLMVFADDAVFDEWESDPQVFLDLRKATWTDWYPESEQELEELLYVVSADDIIREGDEVYEEFIADLDPQDDGSYKPGLTYNYIVPHPNHYKDCYYVELEVNQGAWIYEDERILLDSQGRQIYDVDVCN